MRRRARYARAATATPATAPPRYDTSTMPVICHAVIWSPTRSDTAIEYRTRAVPSLVRLSAFSFMNVRSGSRRLRAATAVASGGATAAPSTSAASHGTPIQVATPATANADATTSRVLIGTMYRSDRRTERSDVVHASRKSSTGRNSSSTVSGGSSICRSSGTKPRARPITRRTRGVAIRSRGASTVPRRIASPSRTVTSSPSIPHRLPPRPQHTA